MNFCSIHRQKIIINSSVEKPLLIRYTIVKILSIFGLALKKKTETKTEDQSSQTTEYKPNNTALLNRTQASNKTIAPVNAAMFRPHLRSRATARGP